ncbi:MAG: class I tRNA ligase family protein, partial [Corallococcus sp.]|nr:class I tRNA ligase family protein [Corallococcus sp.]
KSLGNGVDPVDFIEKYGADTLRFALINGVANGSDIRFSQDKIEGTRNFMNKVWNASRFVLMNTEDKKLSDISKANLTLADKWILTELNGTVTRATELIEKFELGMACQEIYDFVWSDFCDWYIELSKPVLYGADDKARLDNLSVLTYVLDKILKILHPFAPFITEKIYSDMPNHGESIMVERYPVFEKKYNFPNDAKLMEQVKDLISKLRNVRVEYGVAPSKRISCAVCAKESRIKECNVYIEKLAGCSNMEFVDKFAGNEKVVKIVTPIAEIEIPLGNLVDKDKEIERLNKELENVRTELSRAKGKLANSGFVTKAPAQLIEQEKAKVEKYTLLEKQLTVRLDELAD